MREFDTTTHLNPAHVSRAPEVQARYEAHLIRNHQRRLLGEQICDMCNLGQKTERRVIIPGEIEDGLANVFDQEVGVRENEYPYRMWDFKKVKEHDLLIPLEHEASIDTLSIAALGEYVRLLKLLSESGLYDSVGTRLPTSSASSIRDHLHTHLIKEKPGVTLVKLEYDTRSDKQPVVIFSDEIDSQAGV